MILFPCGSDRNRKKKKASRKQRQGGSHEPLGQEHARMLYIYRKPHLNLITLPQKQTTALQVAVDETLSARQSDETLSARQRNNNSTIVHRSFEHCPTSSSGKTNLNRQNLCK